MIDLHTHILPGVDDGAQNVDESLEMLRIQYAQGVETVALTPHFYPDREKAESFLARRAAAWEELNTAITALPEADRKQLPHLVLGAEVAYGQQLLELGDMKEFCYAGTRNMLLELPFYSWDSQLFHQIYDLMNHSGVTPIIAHIERYFFQKKKYLEEIMEMGLPIQVGTDTLLRLASPAMKLLKQEKAQVVASDCHDARRRSPNLNAALRAVRKKLGQSAYNRILEQSEQMLVSELV